ncbi:MAG TPA: MEDS domain-containing protein [bacterium]|nr:MEDS domain-containing protein [bacterium]HPN29397.1 MEDS domain-containing protein [bacterium]
MTGNLLEKQTELDRFPKSGHIAFFYKTNIDYSEWMNLFILDCLYKNEKIILITESQKILEYDSQNKQLLNDKLVCGHIVVLKPDSFIQYGKLDAANLRNKLLEYETETLNTNYSGLKIIYDISLIVSNNDFSVEFLKYKNEFGKNFKDDFTLLLCSYDCSKLNFDIFTKIYFSHKYSFINGILCENFLFINPEETLNETSLDILYKNICGYEVLKRKTSAYDSDVIKKIEDKYQEKMLLQFNKIKSRHIDSALKNIELTALPLLERLLENMENNNNKKILDMIIKNLTNISDPFGVKLDRLKPYLTNTEIEICCMIKQKLRSKDIGKLLKISHTTVERHRNNIRKKLNLDKSGISLINFLSRK